MRRTIVIVLASRIGVAIFAAAVASFAAAAAPHTNIVLIMADDFGYECVGANGGTSYRTPHLDRLAATGVRFTHCYSQPLCTPTRVQLMTGQYNVRNYTKFGSLDREQTTFAQLFRRAGFATCIVGKWQLGRDLSLPHHFGFGEHCLWQLTRVTPRYKNPGLEINGREVDYADGAYGPDVVCQYAVDFIERSQAKPFLLYYPMILTHSPYEPTPDSAGYDAAKSGEPVKGQSASRNFAAMVEYADKLVGRIIAKLDELGLRERTLILFLGDNGTGRGITSQMGEQPVAGGKGAPNDGGMHVPLIASGARAQSGVVVDDLVDTTDVVPTICAAAGVELPPDLPLDGRSFLPQIRGKRAARVDLLLVRTRRWSDAGRRVRPRPTL